MNRSHYKAKIAKACIRLFDLLLILTLFIYIREYHIYGNPFERSFASIQFSLWHFIALVLLALLWNQVLVYMGWYNFRKIEGLARQLQQIVMTVFIGVAIMQMTVNLMRIKGVDGAFPVIFLFVTLLVFIGQRLILIKIIKLIRSNTRRNIRHVLIIGRNERSIALAQHLSKPELGFHILGFIDDENRSIDKEDQNFPYLCKFNQIDRYISLHPVDDVLLTLPMRTYYDEICRIIRLCAAQGIKIRLVTDLFDMQMNIRHSIDWDFMTSSINYETNTLTEFQLDLKRIVDIIISSTALILLSPVFLLVALAILVSEGLPIFFIHDRVGLNKRYFRMIKFRTMITQAAEIQKDLETQNEADGAAFKIAKDPRITKFGKLLRDTSLDELPQLINVFLGSMSIVGPRPLPVRDFKRFYDDSHHRRFTVKPGITGLWQVSGRSDVNFDEWMQLDLKYIDQWTYFLDLTILLKTFPAVLKRKGAR